jgi:hypothetical protein
MVKDADEGVRGRRLASVDLGADEIERALEPRDLQERIVVGGIGVAAFKLLANNLLHPADAEPLRSSCAGAYDALSFLIDYRPVKRIDVHAGAALSNVYGGLANDYLAAQNIDPDRRPQDQVLASPLRA